MVLCPISRQASLWDKLCIGDGLEAVCNKIYVSIVADGGVLLSVPIAKIYKEGERSSS